MALYEYKCEECELELEKLQYNNKLPLCSKCNRVMARKISAPSLIRIKGAGYPARQKWMDDWTPDSPKFSTGSHHGERY